MDHIVYPYCHDSELKNLVSGKHPMIIRGSDSIRLPYGAVKKGDTLYFVDLREELEIRSCGTVSCVICPDKLTKEESVEMVINYQDELQLPDNEFYKIAGLRFLTLIEVENYRQIVPFSVEARNIASTDHWITLEDIRKLVTGREENLISGIIAV